MVVKCGGIVRFIREQPVGAYVSLPIVIESVEQKFTQTGNPYLLVHGVDKEHSRTGALRMWGEREKHVGCSAGDLWFLRGMKVGYVSVWNARDGKFIPCRDRAKVPVSCWCTAIEIVTPIQAIQQAFSR